MTSLSTRFFGQPRLINPTLFINHLPQRTRRKTKSIRLRLCDPLRLGVFARTSCWVSFIHAKSQRRKETQRNHPLFLLVFFSVSSAVNYSFAFAQFATTDSRSVIVQNRT